MAVADRRRVASQRVERGGASRLRDRGRVIAPDGRGSASSTRTGRRPPRPPPRRGPRRAKPGGEDRREAQLVEPGERSSRRRRRPARARPVRDSASQPSSAARSPGSRLGVGVGRERRPRSGRGCSAATAAGSPSHAGRAATAARNAASRASSASRSAGRRRAVEDRRDVPVRRTAPGAARGPAPAAGRAAPPRATARPRPPSRSASRRHWPAEPSRISRNSQKTWPW